MHGNNREHIQNKVKEAIDYSYISLISSKVRIGVVGGGKGAQIKVRHFVNNKCRVEVLAKEISDDLIHLYREHPDNLKLVNGEFNDEFLKDKHIVVIACDDENINNVIRTYCEKNYKIYIDSTDFTKGMGVIPAERSTRTMNFALNTKLGNPKGSVLMCQKIKEYIATYDDYIELTTKIRNNAKAFTEYKKDILSYIYSSEFEDEYKNGTYKVALEERFNKELVKKLLY